MITWNKDQHADAYRDQHGGNDPPIGEYDQYLNDTAAGYSSWEEARDAEEEGSHPTGSASALKQAWGYPDDPTQPIQTRSGTLPLGTIVRRLHTAGWNEDPNDTDAVIASYNNADPEWKIKMAMAPYLPAGYQTGAYNEFGYEIAPIEQLKLELQAQIAAAELEYNRQRLSMLEIPQMRMLDERERHALALDYANSIASQSGWMIPPSELSFLFGSNVGTPVDLPAGPQAGAPGVGGMTTDQFFQQRPDILDFYAQSGWDTSPANQNNILQDWVSHAPESSDKETARQLIAGGGTIAPVAGQAAIPGQPLAGVYGAGGAPQYPDWQQMLQGAIPTLSRQQFEFDQRMFEEDTRRFGLQFAEQQRAIRQQEAFQQAGLTGWLGGTPGDGGIPQGATPTLAMTQMMANPRNLAQSLLSMGMSQQDVGQFLMNQPLTQDLMGYPGVSFAPQQGISSQAAGMQGQQPGSPDIYWGGTQADIAAQTAAGRPPVAGIGPSMEQPYTPQTGVQAPYMPVQTMPQQPNAQRPIASSPGPEAYFISPAQAQADWAAMSAAGRFPTGATPFVEQPYTPQVGGQAPYMPVQTMPQQPNVSGRTPTQMPTDISGRYYAGGSTQPTSGQGVPMYNPNFPFVGGRQMPVRQSLQWFQEQSPKIPLISSMASLSGRDPNQFWAEFSAFLPKGGRVGQSRFV